MSSFTNTGEGLLLHLDEAEVPILRRVASDVLEILEDRNPTVSSTDPLARMVGISSNDKLPESPILARLFPNAYDDEKLSGEFRRYTEAALYSEKQKAIAELLASLPSSGEAIIELDLDGIDRWMRAINDLRLALGVVLDVDVNSDEQFAEISETDPVFFTVQVFYWLGWLLESLIEHATD